MDPTRPTAPRPAPGLWQRLFPPVVAARHVHRSCSRARSSGALALVIVLVGAFAPAAASGETPSTATATRSYELLYRQEFNTFRTTIAQTAWETLLAWEQEGGQFCATDAECYDDVSAVIDLGWRDRKSGSVEYRAHLVFVTKLPPRHPSQSADRAVLVFPAARFDSIRDSLALHRSGCVLWTRVTETSGSPGAPQAASWLLGELALADVTANTGKPQACLGSGH